MCQKEKKHQKNTSKEIAKLRPSSYWILGNPCKDSALISFCSTLFIRNEALCAVAANAQIESSSGKSHRIHRPCNFVARERKYEKGGGFLTRLPIAVLTRPLSSWLVARLAPLRSWSQSRRGADPRDTATRTADCLPKWRYSRESSLPRGTRNRLWSCEFHPGRKRGHVVASIPFDSLCSLQVACNTRRCPQSDLSPVSSFDQRAARY